MKKVLVVDNDVDILFLVEYILKQQGFIIKTHQGCHGIYPVIDGFLPDLIILEVSLFGKDCTKICKEIKLKKNAPKVIIFSTNENLLQSYREIQAESYIEKPFSIRDFCKTVDKVLYRKPALPFLPYLTDKVSILPLS